MSVAEEIKKMAELMSEGHVTAVEFDLAKKALIGSEAVDLSDQKNIEYYAATVNAWLSYRQEGNKQLLLISAGALALLVGMVSGSDKIIPFGVHFWLLVACAVFYFVCLSSSLLEIKNSPLYLEKVVGGGELGDIEFKLRALEAISGWSFWLGAMSLFSLVFYRLFQG